VDDEDIPPTANCGPACEAFQLNSRMAQVEAARLPGKPNPAARGLQLNQRCVRGLISFADPAGNRLEAFHGGQIADEPFRPGIKDPRFIIEHAGDPEYSLLTRSSDGQMLFLANMLSKMKHSTKLGSRIAEVHNGSSLFTGDAGQGESNVRRWIIENDWLGAALG
jgi:hypothetical protein